LRSKNRRFVNSAFMILGFQRTLYIGTIVELLIQVRSRTATMPPRSHQRSVVLGQQSVVAIMPSVAGWQGSPSQKLQSTAIGCNFSWRSGLSAHVRASTTGISGRTRCRQPSGPRNSDYLSPLPVATRAGRPLSQKEPAPNAPLPSRPETERGARSRTNLGDHPPHSDEFRCALFRQRSQTGYNV
jgi:hypothetical protein